MVSAFERELADYCGAKYAIAAANGTVTLQAALVALDVKPGDRVAVPPLTMSATTIAVLNVGAVPVFVDVDPETWLMDYAHTDESMAALLPVSLYGLHQPWNGPRVVDDAAQTLREHIAPAFTSLSFQASKILSTGEGGALLTDNEGLAVAARSYLSLGYRMSATQARIDPATLKSPTFDRHHRYPCVNGRMNDCTARLGLERLRLAEYLLEVRQDSAAAYREAIDGCAFLTPQRVSPNMTHDYWAFAVACDTPGRALWLQDAVVRHGGERPYAAWKLTYHEPAFLWSFDEAAYPDVEWFGSVMGPDGHPHNFALGACPVAEGLQPRLVQFQTNDLASAERNARALRLAIEEAA
jgi:perosamine synthetase